MGYPPSSVFAEKFKIEFLGDIKFAMTGAIKDFPAKGDYDFTNLHCFEGSTPVVSPVGTIDIKTVQPGSVVLSFDDEGRLTHGSVARVFRGITDSWLILSCGLTVTPGHRFLNERGGFERIDAIVERGGCIVLEDGTLSRVTAERIVYSEATRHLYEEAEEAVALTAGSSALKPEVRRGWRTYNFEVEEYHTYIAGGVRVHNDSLGDYVGYAAMMHNDAYVAVGTTAMAKEFGWDAVTTANWAGTFGQPGFAERIQQQVDAYFGAVENKTSPLPKVCSMDWSEASLRRAWSSARLRRRSMPTRSRRLGRRWRRPVTRPGGIASHARTPILK